LKKTKSEILSLISQYQEEKEYQESLMKRVDRLKWIQGYLDQLLLLSPQQKLDAALIRNRLKGLYREKMESESQNLKLTHA